MTEAAERFDPAVLEMMHANQANWDARTPVHLASRFYDVEEQPDPFRWFAPFEWEDLGELAGREVAHLQCHLGTETLAFARRGARTVGLDISGASVAAARDLAAKADCAVDYVRANVYDAVDALGERRFDVVYTGKGALCYLPDLDRWAEVIARLLKPGGRLYLVEFHPCSTPSVPSPPPTRARTFCCDTTISRGAAPSTATPPTRTPTVRRSTARRRASSGGTAWTR